jgi:hypothetical protein
MKKLIYLLVICISFSAMAQETGTDVNAQNSGWQFDISPYLWMADASADVSFLNLTVPVEAEFGDILSNLEAGFLLHAEARNGRHFLGGDIMFLRVGKTGTIDRLNIQTDLTLKQLIAELFGGYTLVATDGGFFVDGLAGMRYFELDNVLEVGQLNILDRVANATDPIVGVRLRLQGQRWMGSLRSDMGGFGIGSEFSWKSNVLVGYRFAQWFYAYGGFQAYGIDYEKDNFGMDVTTAGFLVGVNFHLD